jgi:hypothetical protein
MVSRVKIGLAVGMIDSVVIDFSISCIADGSAGDRTDGSADQSTCGFVVSFVADRSADGCTSQTT